MENAPLLNWYAVYVKSRHEFAAETDLRRRGIETYLPLIRRLRQWRDRRKSIEFPLFPGYLFVRVEPNPVSLINVLRAKGVVRLVSANAGSPTPVPHAEMDSLKILVESGDEFDIYPYLQEGTRVLIKDGPLKGAAGRLVNKETRHMFVVNIDILGRSVGVRAYAEDLEPA